MQQLGTAATVILTQNADLVFGPVLRVLEGCSLLPVLHGTAADWRDFAVSEYDFSKRLARKRLNLDVSDCKLTMLFDGRWKYIHSESLRPMLYDLKNDPDEFNDLGGDPEYEAERARLAELLWQWSRRTRSRVTVTDDQITRANGDELSKGIKIGFWDEKELTEARVVGESGN